MKTNWYLGETKEYNRFDFIDSNRDINESNLKKIEKSILDIGIQVPIVVNEDYKIIEGQHRFIALRRNDLVVPYIVSKKASVSDIDSLQESRKWTALDFCKSRAAKGDVSCVRALDIAEEWHQDSNKKMNVIRSLEVLMSSRTANGLRVRLKNGTFLINEEYAENVYEAIRLMSGLEMATSAYGNKITRTLKTLCYDFKGLDLDIIDDMTRKNYIAAYSNESDQYRYMRDIYLKSKKRLKK